FFSPVVVGLTDSLISHKLEGPPSAGLFMPARRRFPSGRCEEAELACVTFAPATGRVRTPPVTDCPATKAAGIGSSAKSGRPQKMKWLLIIVVETGPDMPGLDVQHMDSESGPRSRRTGFLPRSIGVL